MIIEPQQAQPGYMKRWSLEALKLMYRTPLVLVLYFLVLFGASDLARYCNAINLLMGLFGISFLMSIAKHVDKKTLNLSSLLQIFSSCFKATFQVIVNDYFSLTLLFLLLSLCAISSYRGNVPELNSYVLIKMMADMSWAGFFFHKSIRLKIFSYLLRIEYQLEDPDLIEQLCEKAEEKNSGMSIKFSNISTINLLFYFFAPPLGLVTLLFLPFFTYVSFREIFMNQIENQKQEQSASDIASEISMV